MLYTSLILRFLSFAGLPRKWGIKALCFGRCRGPVSYTHLDVYKRQALYVACGYAKANANALRNMPKGSYSDLYLTISKMISKKKSNRYNADMIRNLNSRKHEGERECKVCRRIAPVSYTHLFSTTYPV